MSEEYMREAKASEERLKSIAVQIGELADFSEFVPREQTFFEKCLEKRIQELSLQMCDLACELLELHLEKLKQAKENFGALSALEM